MQLLFTIVYIRITTLTWIFHDHPLVEYPLYNNFIKAIKTYRNRKPRKIQKGNYKA